MKHKRILGGLALALAGMTALAACSSSSSSGSSTPSSSSSASSVKSGGSFTYALDQDVPGFNINQAADSAFVLQEIMNQIWPTVYVTTDTIKLTLDTDYVTSATVTSSSPQTAGSAPAPARFGPPRSRRSPGPRVSWVPRTGRSRYATRWPGSVAGSPSSSGFPTGTR